MIPPPWGPALAVLAALLVWAGTLGLAARGRSGLVASIAGTVAIAALFAGWHVDDAGIVFAYARAIAQGQGLVPGVGLEPVEGFSDPLWVGALALAAWLGAPVPFAAKVLQVGLAVATTVGVHRLALRGGAGLLGADLAAALVATSGAWMIWSASGLEVALFGWLLVATAAAAGLPGLGGGAAVLGLVAAAAWVRPEGGGQALLVAVVTAWWGGPERRPLAPRPQWVAFAAGLGLLAGGGGLLAARLATLGTWLPNTAIAKLGGPLSTRLLAGGAYAAVGLVLTGWIVWFLAAAPRRGADRGRGALAAAVVALASLAHAAVVGGDWMGHARLLAPSIPVVLALSAGAAIPSRAGSPVTRAQLGLVAAAALIGVAVLAHGVARPTLPIDHGLRRGELYLEVGRSACGIASVATPDIGGVLHAWPHVQVHDLVGLVDAEAARHRRHPDYWAARLQARRVAIVDLHGGWARRTGLSDAVLDARGYRILCRRWASPEAPTLWVDARCRGTVSPRGAELVERWCELGSGVPW